MTSNDQYLGPVTARIGQAILTFCRQHVGNTFRADDLRDYVHAATGKCAPGSADRVLRHLRQAKVLDYVVINRSKSLYQLLFVVAE